MWPSFTSSVVVRRKHGRLGWSQEVTTTQNTKEREPRKTSKHKTKQSQEMDLMGITSMYTQSVQNLANLWLEFYGVYPLCMFVWTLCRSLHLRCPRFRRLSISTSTHHRSIVGARARRVVPIGTAWTRTSICARRQCHCLDCPVTEMRHLEDDLHPMWCLSCCWQTWKATMSLLQMLIVMCT